MTSLTLTLDQRDLRRALEGSPKTLRKHLGQGVFRIVTEMAREARRLAPKAHSVLTNSISQRQPKPLTGEFFVGADYGRSVEEGTGAGGYPGAQTMLDWIKAHNITPRDPDMDQADLAFVMARRIALTGTPAQPFMKPAFESKKQRAQQLIDQALNRALAEMGA